MGVYVSIACFFLHGWSSRSSVAPNKKEAAGSQYNEQSLELRRNDARHSGSKKGL